MLSNLEKFFRFSSCFLVLSVFFSKNAFSSSSEDYSSSEERGQKAQIPSLKKTLEALKSSIEAAKSERSIASLVQSSINFDKLTYDSEDWEKNAKNLALEKWPSQTWKQSIGGNLFYPQQISNILSSDSTHHLARRRDILWCLALAASHKHPVAQYYLARKLDDIHDEHSSKPRPTLVTFLYKESLDVLEKCLHVPQACYIVASNYAFEASKVGMREFNLKKSLELHGKGAIHDSLWGYQNRLALLLKRSLYPSLELPLPTGKEYLAVGEYGPSYIHAASLSKKFKKKEELLKKAISFNFPHANLYLGALYEEKDKVQEALECYEQAGYLGVPRGYILLSQRLIGDQTLRYKTHDLTKISREDLERSIAYLKKAGQAGDFEGWDQLLGLYRSLYEHYKNEEDFEQLLFALEKGIQMGSSYAYRQTQSMFPSRYKKILSTYGSPCHENILEYLSRKLKFDERGEEKS
jgi:hypothetical protein